MKLLWTPKTKVAVVMIVALLLPIAAFTASRLLQLYDFQQTKPVHAIVNNQLLQVIREVEKQIGQEKTRLARGLAARLEPAGPLNLSADLVKEKLGPAVGEKSFADLVVFYNPQTGPVILKRMVAADSFEAREIQENASQLEASLTSTYDRLVEMLKEVESEKIATSVDDYLVELKRTRHQYNTAHYVLVHDSHNGAVGVIGFTIDREYLRSNLFPAAYDKVPVSEYKNMLFDKALVGIRDPETWDLVWTSEPATWSVKEANVRKPFDSASFFGTLEAKLKGESIDAISSNFFNQNLALVLALALVLFTGLFFTWRAVNREIELARTKSDFVSNVSHELKTPLALIRLFAETLELGRVRPEKQQEYYATIRKESERLTGLINNLLDFSRIEAGGKQYRFEKTNIACLVGQAIETYRYQLDQKGFALEEKIDPGIPDVAVDREAYALCVLNLLDNAMKYSGESRQVAVRLNRENGCACLEVEDRGIGIHRKDQEHIFEKFFRAGDAMVNNTRGSGLGLSLVKHVAQAHHGTVTVESSLGVGSKFILKVPIDDASRN